MNRPLTDNFKSRDASASNKEIISPILFKLPRVNDLGNPLNGESPSDFEEDLDPVDEEEHHHHEHQRCVAPVEDVAVELVVLAMDS